MNISDITTQNTSVHGRKTAFGINSFLSIGKKGQTVEGMISTVSDRISINFNGVEVTVSKSAVQNATEGEIRKFKIMDVSKDSIVLKEVGNNTISGDSRVMMGTSVSAGSYAFPDYLTDSQNVSEAKHQAGQNLTVLTGEDYQKIESEQGTLEEYKESVLDRAVERIKEKHQWEQERMEAYHQFRQETEEYQEKLQLLGFLDQKNPEQIAKALEAADLPVSDANIARISAALQMAQTALELTDTARAYIVENHMAPTIENLYHGQYSASSGMNVSVVDEVTWQQLLPQVETILTENGIGLETGLAHAKWLFANDLPVTVESLQTMQTLDEIQQIEGNQILEQILQAMSAGAAPEKASLDGSQFVIARNILRDFSDVTEQDIITALQTSSGNEITLELLKQVKTDALNGTGSQAEQNGSAAQAASGMPLLSEKITGITQAELAVLTTKRQIEEIRLKMTLQSVIKMSGKGIEIEVTPLKQLVDELRQMENTYYSETVKKGGAEITDQQTGLMQETLAKITDIRNAPAAILGNSVRQQSLLTVNQLHKAAVSATVQMQRYQMDYEAVGTQVRKDLGDSIQKAFHHIPELLNELNLEDTQANERAVRILGYNRMEITTENIVQVKEYDARVNAVIDNMKPSVVLELIRRGGNPLDTPLDELNETLCHIAKEQNITDEEKYSRYLWQLEQENSITREERNGYIGIYRLLNNIDKTDGAAVGAVLDAGKEMTLGNLLTAVRTIRGNGIDAKIDDTFGGLSELQYMGQSISDQIASGFAGSTEGQEPGDSNHYPDQGEQGSPSGHQEYYSRVAEQALDSLTPSSLQQISDGDMEQLLNTSLEMFQEQLEHAAGNPELERAMYEQYAEQLRETAARSEEAVNYLNGMDVADSIANIQAAEMILQQGYDVQQEGYSRRNLLNEKEKQEYEAVVSQMPESLESEETMTEQCEKLEGFLEKILEKSYEQKEISYSDMRSLKLLGQGIQLQKQLASRHSYDIPIVTGDTVTSLNVTLIQGSEDSGRVQVSISPVVAEEGQNDTEDTLTPADYGNISMEIRLSQGEIKGLVLCDSRNGFEQLSANRDKVISRLKEDGFVVKNLSYSMDYKSRSDMAGGTQDQQVPTAQLYRIAKIMVQHTMEIMAA